MSERGTSSLLASPAAQHLDLPAGSRPLPGPDTLDHVLGCPIAQLIVAGRSGSMLIHAYLDGHPEVLHVPHTFKYFDFVAANPDLLSLTPAALGQRFVESPLTPFLFDSAKSVLVGGRLGPEMNVYLEVDRRRFVEVFASLMREAPDHLSLGVLRSRRGVRLVCRPGAEASQGAAASPAPRRLALSGRPDRPQQYVRKAHRSTRSRCSGRRESFRRFAIRTIPFSRPSISPVSISCPTLKW